MAVLCGIDVSSSTLEARIGAVGSFVNTEAGVELLAVFCRDHGVTLAVMEATGGYERLAYRLLWAEGVAAARWLQQVCYVDQRHAIKPGTEVAALQGDRP